MEPNPICPTGTKLLRQIAEQHLIGCTTDAHDRRGDIDPTCPKDELVRAAALEMIRVATCALASDGWSGELHDIVSEAWSAGCDIPGQGRLL